MTMISSPLFLRVVPQDRDRGYMILASFDPIVVQRTAAQYITLGDPTRQSLADAVAILRRNYRPSEMRDVTASGIAKKLMKSWGEEVTNTFIEV